MEAGVAAVRRIAPTLPVSVDTFRAEVARRVLETFGPVIVNDISAGEMDPAIVDVVAEYDVPYIAMHMRGTPATMQGMTSYRDVVEEVVSYFRLRAEQLRRCGVRRLILDPGFGSPKPSNRTTICFGGCTTFARWAIPYWPECRASP